MREQFENVKFKADALALIEIINDILEQYEAQGYDLSLRQLYYQLVSRNTVPNTEQSYKRVGRIVSDGRLAGLIDWEMIKDRGREMIVPPHWDSPGAIIASAASQFRMDVWKDQPFYVEVMVEKQALEGVLIPVCTDLQVPFTANKGYSSSSAFYEAGKRMAQKIEEEKKVVVIYLGDHDPSGIDMSRDVEERLCMFSEVRTGGLNLQVDRVALNIEQVEEMDLPENPCKTTDSRSGDYIAKFGYSSWELDALPPDMLAGLVRNSVELLRDDDAWDHSMELQQRNRDILKRLAREHG